jgi:hypothetical protein
MRYTYCGTWNMARNTEIIEKREIHTVGPGILRETLIKVKKEKCTL